MTSGQVLQRPYAFEEARVVLKEMADALALELTDRSMVTDQIVLSVGFDVESLKDPKYRGETVTDRYGRAIPKHAHGTVNLGRMTASARCISAAVEEWYEKNVEKALLIRRLNLTANHLTEGGNAQEDMEAEQLDLFEDPAEKEKRRQETELQKTVLSIKRRYGKNAILKGMSLEAGATAVERNRQIGGHKA